MSIEIRVSPSAQIRRLNQTGLNADDIIKVTGWPAVKVKAALAVKRPIKK